MARRRKQGKPNERMYIQLPLGGQVHPSDIPPTRPEVKFVFVNACNMLWLKMADAFPYKTTYLAPFYDVTYEDAMMFAARLYQHVFLGRMSYEPARRKTAAELSLKTVYPHTWIPA